MKIIFGDRVMLIDNDQYKIEISFAVSSST